MSRDEREHRNEIKDQASPRVGGMGMYQYEVPRDTGPGGPVETEVVHATVALRTPHGHLLGSDQGEFGGELALAPLDRWPLQPSILYEANIEDLFLMPYGILVTTGYMHMSQDLGSILLVTFSAAGEPAVKKLFDLPGAVQTSWITVSNELLVNTSGGTFTISSPTRIEQVRCREHWWQ